MKRKSTKFSLNHLSEYTDKSIIEEIKRVANLIDSDVFMPSNFKEHSRVGLTTVRRHFGSWCEALEYAGLGHLYHEYKPITEKVKSQRGKGLSGQKLLDELRKVSKKLKRDTFSIDEFNQHSTISAATVSRRFGGWGKALKQAGLAPSKVQRRYTDKECFENLLTVWTHYGRPPKYHEMPLPPSTISVCAYIIRWGSWRKALHAFVEFVNSDENLEQNEEPKPKPMKPSKVTKNVQSDAEKREIKIGLRYKILKRDNFRCLRCGRSPATCIGLELHVDHIIPWSKGGVTIPENLRTLCRDCNIGKGSKLE